MAFTTPATANVGDALTAAFYNVNVRDNILALPRGIRAYTTSSSNTITSAVVTGLNTTFLFEADRFYRISTHLNITTNASSRAIINIVIAGHTSNTREYDRSGNAGEFHTFGETGVLYAKPGAGSKAVQVTYSQISGTSQLSATASELHWLVIDDVGFF